MTEKPFALSLRLQPSPYLVPFDLVVQLLPKELDEVVRSKIDVLDANRVIAFGLVPLITTKFVAVSYSAISANPKVSTSLSCTAITLGLGSQPISSGRGAKASSGASLLAMW